MEVLLLCRWLLPDAVVLMNMIDILFLGELELWRASTLLMCRFTGEGRTSHYDNSDSHRIATQDTQARPHLQAVVLNGPLSYGSRRRRCHIADTSHSKITRRLLSRGIMAKTKTVVIGW